MAKRVLIFNGRKTQRGGRLSAALVYSNLLKVRQRATNILVDQMSMCKVVPVSLWALLSGPGGVAESGNGAVWMKGLALLCVFLVYLQSCLLHTRGAASGAATNII